MEFRFTLSHDVLGSLEISPPDGWDEAKLKLERDQNFHSLIEYFDGSFIFYGDNGEINGGIDFIREIESTYGFDADISILIELSFDGYGYETVFSGLLKLEAIQEMEDNRAQIPIQRNDFWSKFINRLDTPVDIQSAQSLDNENVNQFDSINLKLSSQKIQKKYVGFMTDSFSIFAADWSASDYLQIGMDDVDLEEVKDVFNIPTATNPVIPVWIFAPTENGEYEFDLRIECSIIFYTYAGVFPNCETRTIDGTQPKIAFYIQKNNETPIAFPVSDFVAGGNTSSVYHYLNSLNLVIGDIVRVYGDMASSLTEGDICTFWIYSKTNRGLVQRMLTIGGTCTPLGGSEFSNILDLGVGPSGNASPTYFKITGQTTHPQSNSFGFLLHDAAGQITDRIINQNDSFHSEFLGSAQTVYKQYDSDGCGWKYAILKGLQLRLYSLIEKPFFMSFMKWWDGANPILNLGLGYEEVNGQEVIRVEEKDHFYDDSGVSLNISNVRQISRNYDTQVIFKTVKIGYKQWQSENISGIDDAQTKHTYASRLQKAGIDLTLESEFIGASLAIETTRRTTREKSADYKFDNETFIIAINPIPVDVSPETSPDVNDFEPELDENFTSITNLLNSETRYNSRITPARNFIRWLKHLCGGLQKYTDSVFKFTSGEGNYDMVSDMSNVSDGCDEYKQSLSESQSIPVLDDCYHLADLYEIQVPLEWEDYLTIRENRKKAIGISQTDDNHIKFFIKELDYELTQSRAIIRAWPTEPFEIRVIDSMPEMLVCEPRTDPNAITVDTTLITADSEDYTADRTLYTI